MIKQDIADKIKYFLIILFVILLPFNKKLIPLIIAIWILTWLIEGRFLKKLGQLKTRLPLILMLTFFVIHLFGLIFTKNLNSGLFDIEVKLSLFILPLIILDNKLILEKIYFNTILKVFVFSNLIISFICIGQSFYKYIIKDDWYMLYYYNFSVFHHTSYSSMYLLFSIAIIFYLMFTKSIKKTKSIIIYSSIIIVFLISLYFISSKAGFIALFVLILFLIFTYIVKYKKIILSGIFLIIFVGGFIVAINLNNRFNNYYKQVGQTLDKVLENGLKGSNDERLQAWNVALEISKNNILFGVGTGDVKDELLKSYKEQNLDEHYNRKFNAHNQFIETLVGIGVFGLLALICITFFPVFKKNNLLITMFGIIIIVNFFFESMLNTQAGVTFFAFFYCLLFIRSPLKNDKQRNN